MDHYNKTNMRDLDDEFKAQPGHWQPALRPEVLESSTDKTSAPGHDYHSSLDRQEPWTALEADFGVATYTETDSEPLQQTSTQNSEPSVRSPNPASASNIAQPSWNTYTRAGIHQDDEMPSDEDDERLDPAWGITKLDTAQILGVVNRSTTFPDYIPPSQVAELASPAQQQDSSIPDDTSRAVEDLPLAHDPSVPAPSFDNPPESLDWMNGADGKFESELDQETAGFGVSDVQDPTEARFDEGVPLVQTEDFSEPPAQVEPYQPSTQNFGALVEEDDESSFFSNINATNSHLDARPELERKSTETVLESLHMPPSDEPDSPKLAHPVTEKTAQAEEDFFSSKVESNNPEPGNMDAMWGAALDDDEFLVEDADDLLPDSDPGSPSSFIASLQGSKILEEESFNPAAPVGATYSVIQQTPPRDNRPDFARQSSSNPYAPHQPSTSDLTQLSPTTHGTVGLTRPGLAPLNSFQAHLQQRPNAPVHAESFSDQAKGGYKSPYDLPMELSKPRKRAHAPQPAQNIKSIPPPPRSSSMSDNALLSPFTPTTPGFPNNTMGPPALPSPSVPSRSISASVQPGASNKLKSTPSSFFEELPISARPRTSTGQGRYTPQQPSNIAPPQLLPQSPPQFQNSPPPMQPSPPKPADPYAQYQLRPPERLDPYANVALQPPAVPTPGPASTRYSPAPPTVPTGPKAATSQRYSPAPPQITSAPIMNRYASQPAPPAAIQPPPPAVSQQPPPVNRYASQPPLTHQPPAPSSLPFQPRTSSPLAYHRSSADLTANPVPTGPPMAKVVPAAPYEQLSVAPSLAGQPFNSMPPPASNFAPPPLRPSPSKVSIVDEMIEAPQRSQTQSPSKQRPRATLPVPFDNASNRPATAHEQGHNRNIPQIEPAPPLRSAVQARGYVQELDFVQPMDDSQYDPLQRWKGAPIFHFGFGGNVVRTFPKHVPRYGAGSTRPQIKPTVGELSIVSLKDIVVAPEHISKFPGPLRSKSKKKDLIAWMTASIATFETESPPMQTNMALPDPRRRHDEKILLWKILRALVEHDGTLDGSADALRSINTILAPEVHAVDETTATRYRSDSSLSGIYRPSGTSARPDSVDPMAIEALRKHLLEGNRQEAVWHAVDCRLWSHALLISSTLDRSIWKQVVQEFVKQEVKTSGTNAEPLCALYEIFGGNLEESIDQLVPPSARAGLQMVSKTDTTGPTKNALDGLNRWKETLSLVINNRSQGDYQALATLGRLLGDYGRVEASHICHLFSKSALLPQIFGGPDDPQANIVLLGADHRAHPFDFARAHEAILLTEVYEFATLVLSSGSTTPFMPHLAAYKLQRASLLADEGYKAEAQSYTDALAATLKSSTKISPYYHPLLLAELDELSNRLKQIPVQSSGSWITKPSLEKVSGSVWSKFSSFVAGEDSDAESKGSGRDASEAGPFAKVTGTPSLSRSGSQTDLYGSYPAAAPAVLPSTKAGSRYAPNGMSSTRSSSELTRGRPSLDSQRSPKSNSYVPNGRPSPYEPVNMFQPGPASQPINPYQALGASPPTRNYQESPPQSSYLPNPGLHESSPARINQNSQHEPYIPTPPPEDTIQQSYQPNLASLSGGAPPTMQYSSYAPGAAQSESDIDMTPTQAERSFDTGYQPSAQSHAYEPAAQSYGYAPPAESVEYDTPAQSYGYEPPQDSGYVPYNPEPDSPEETKEKKPKKKSFMDDDDDDFPRISKNTVSSVPSQLSSPPAEDDGATRKRANDAAAEAAFRAAAEADAARAKDKTLKPKSSWFGGWLGAKKEDGSLDAGGGGSGNKSAADAKVYKANLGEKKMKLYYDEKLKKWVNPDNPDAATKSATPPPPPRMGGTPAPPMAGPPRSSPALPSTPAPPSMMPPPPAGGSASGSHPPSRTGTPANGATTGANGPPPPSSLPAHITGSTLQPPSRPGTALSNASSIDDLIGPATTGRKSIKGKKGAKGRYVDVMAL